MKKNPGRPKEGRVPMFIRVKPDTKRAIRRAKSKSSNTDGKVIDAKFSE